MPVVRGLRRPARCAVSDAEQLALLDEGGRAHRCGHDTEHAAADSMRGKANTLRLAVLRLLRTAPDGLTDDEGGQLLRKQYPAADRLTVGRRRQELCTVGLAADTGKRRQTPSGRWAIVWTATR